jgi:hypothetical protein
VNPRIEISYSHVRRVSRRTVGPVLLVLLLLCCNSCKREIVHRRPNGVPETAVWAGGVDGGAFIECAFPISSKTNSCTVYNDATGDIWMSGAFALRGNSSDNLKVAPRFAGADGTNIHLTDGSVLEPKASSRPQPVPEPASLAENGVYVNCVREKTDTFRCELFLAADGRKLSSGVYQSDDGSVIDTVKPKLAESSAIYLQSGRTLRLTPANSR